MVDPSGLRGITRLNQVGSHFKPEAQEEIDKMVNDLREKLNLPFDELYHKEKALVEAVIEADKALKRK